MIAGVLLAAGNASRFGSDKRFYEIAGRPLILYALDTSLASRLSRVYVVHGPGDARVTEVLGASCQDRARLRFIENDRASRGMMSSLKAALRSVPAECEAVVVFHADMPLVPFALIDRLIDEFQRSKGPVVPECDDQWRHPRLIPRWLFDEFLSLHDDERGTKVLNKHTGRITTIRSENPDAFLDVDSIADIGRLETLLIESRATKRRRPNVKTDRYLDE